MSARDDLSTEAAAGAELPVIAECRLDVPGLLEQRARYRRLAEHVTGIERAPGRLVVGFSPSVDAALAEETLAVERECCPFFVLRWDAVARRLEAGVEDPRQDAALDALASALGAEG